MKKLLVCISHHSTPGRAQYLEEILKGLQLYQMQVNIIIDTNVHTGKYNEDGIKVLVHENMEHPFHLTWQHRAHMQANIDKYDWFMYIEDDMFVPWECFENYMNNFKLLWDSFVPSFVRIEQANGKQYITDAVNFERVYEQDIIRTNNKMFYTLKNPYHAFWIMPKTELKETMIPNFVRVDQSREHAASYPMWELFRKPVVEIYKGESGQYYVNHKCYSYHLANNYAISNETPYAKIEAKKLFI